MKTVLVLFGLLFALTAHAEQMQRFGDIEIHYNAMPSDELTPEVARAYQIERSRNRGLVTLSVIRRGNDGVGVPLKAAVGLQIKMLTTQTVDVKLREVVEGDAIYYLGDFHLMPPVTLRFKVDARVANGEPMRFEFSRNFY